MTAAKKAAASSPKKAGAGQEGRLGGEEGRRRRRQEGGAGQEGGRRPRRRRGPKKAAAPRRRRGQEGRTAQEGRRQEGHRRRRRPAPAKKAAPVKEAGRRPPRRRAAGRRRRPPAGRRSARPSGPYAKDTKFLDAQRALLLEERAIYAGQAVDLRAEADSLALEREPGDVQFDEESGEGGTVTVDRERNLALSAQASAAVEEIDDALRKIDRKTYGGCERCYQPIPKARLRALPFARLCVACKSGGLSRR